MHGLRSYQDALRGAAGGGEEKRMQRGQLIGGPRARVPLYVPYADFYQYQAGAGRLADRA